MEESGGQSAHLPLGAAGERLEAAFGELLEA